MKALHDAAKSREDGGEVLGIVDGPSVVAPPLGEEPQPLASIDLQREHRDGAATQRHDADPWPPDAFEVRRDPSPGVEARSIGSALEQRCPFALEVRLGVDVLDDSDRDVARLAFAEVAPIRQMRALATHELETGAQGCRLRRDVVRVRVDLAPLERLPAKHIDREPRHACGQLEPSRARRHEVAGDIPGLGHVERPGGLEVLHFDRPRVARTRSDPFDDTRNDPPSERSRHARIDDVACEGRSEPQRTIGQDRSAMRCHAHRGQTRADNSVGRVLGDDEELPGISDEVRNIRLRAATSDARPDTGVEGLGHALRHPGDVGGCGEPDRGGAR